MPFTSVAHSPWSIAGDGIRRRHCAAVSCWPRERLCFWFRSSFWISCKFTRIQCMPLRWGSLDLCRWSPPHPHGLLVLVFVRVSKRLLEPNCEVLLLGDPLRRTIPSIKKERVGTKIESPNEFSSLSRALIVSLVCAASKAGPPSPPGRQRRTTCTAGGEWEGRWNFGQSHFCAESFTRVNWTYGLSW